MNRNFFRFWLVALLVGSGRALALEIGEIQVQSALNQLFDARIPLPTLTPEELAKVSVKLAPPPMFKEFDLERVPTLANLVFSIEYNAEGHVYVRVISTKPIREPSLGLLLEFAWPRGKTFREFTVLLDPVQRLAQRPGDRTKTVLDAPPIAAAMPETGSGVPPSDSHQTEPAPPAVAAAPEIAGSPELSPPPAEAPSAPVRFYRPGDTYGPVATGEGLWGIALKVRPDPGITREEMMQALFKANPQAFSKLGISGLKTGAVLRIPTWREIADFTGSPAARQLAEAEQPAAAPSTAVAEIAALNNAAPVPTDSAFAEQTRAGSPEVFPLPPPVSLEPTVVSASPAPPLETTQPLSEPAQPQPEPVAIAPEPLTPKLEPVAVPSEPGQPQPKLDTIASEWAALIQEPASATPLLSLAVADVITSSTVSPILRMAIPIQHNHNVVVSSLPEPVLPEPTSEMANETAAAAAPSPVLLDPETPDAPKPPSVAIDALGWLAEIEQRIPRSVLESLPPAHAGDLSVTPITVPPVPSAPTVHDALSWLAEIEQRIPRSVLESLPPAHAGDLSVTLIAVPPVPLSPTAAQAVAAPPRPETAHSIESAASASREYGPVVANERLWDIATRTRPDPGISKDQMMRSLFKLNPQAFSKPDNMDSLKVGVMLRIPTLQEIAEYTDSRVAKQLLLERRQTAEAHAAQKPVAP